MEVVPVGTTNIQYEGALDDQKVYDFIKDTLQGRGYKVSEDSYVQFGGKNYSIDWTAMKLVDDYMAYRLRVKLDYRGLSEAPAMKDGKQIKIKTGTVQVRIVSDVLLDYLDKWTVGISKLIRPVYDKMNQEVISQRKATFNDEIQNIKNAIQSGLGQ
jgi:hypothetical protein